MKQLAAIGLGARTLLRPQGTVTKLSMQPRDERVESLTRRYTEEAGAYQELWAPVLHDVGLGLLRELRGTGPDLVLDVGSGAGTLLPDLQAAFPGARVIGVDRAFGMLQLAPRGPARAVMDAAQLAIAARSVDVALLAFVLFHLPEPRAGLVEARRVLRPGGRVATVTWASDSVVGDLYMQWVRLGTSHVELSAGMKLAIR